MVLYKVLQKIEMRCLHWELHSCHQSCLSPQLVRPLHEQKITTEYRAIFEVFYLKPLSTLDTRGFYLYMVVPFGSQKLLAQAAKPQENFWYRVGSFSILVEL